MSVAVDRAVELAGRLAITAHASSVDVNRCRRFVVNRIKHTPVRRMTRHLSRFEYCASTVIDHGLRRPMSAV